jgi:hypothetical protein
MSRSFWRLVSAFARSLNLSPNLLSDMGVINTNGIAVPNYFVGVALESPGVCCAAITIGFLKSQNAKTEFETLQHIFSRASH